MQADKVAGLQKGQNKQHKKNSKTTIANQADVTVPDEPHQLFRFSSLSEEEGFGLFEENHAGLAMAAEAHASFMDLEFSLSQSDAHDDSAMVCMLTPWLIYQMSHAQTLLCIISEDTDCFPDCAGPPRRA